MARMEDVQSNYLSFGEQEGKPASPTAGNRKLYFLDDGKLYQLDYLGNEVEIGGTGGGHIIADENGADMPARTYLHFTGDGVIVTDDEGNDETVVTIGGFTPWEEQASTPLLTWLSSTPTESFNIWYTSYQNDTYRFVSEISLTDGNGVTGLIIQPPINIGGLSYFFIGTGCQQIGSADPIVENYIVPYQSNNPPYGIAFGNFQTVPIGEVCYLYISGTYSIDV